ncbi:hypothetical protein, partial [Microbacterium invictum]|uniref:hypothetical protein n=1 Tax=Microbacterium invictum TaxID=515415 RepID=UPI0031E65491
HDRVDERVALNRNISGPQRSEYSHHPGIPCGRERMVYGVVLCPPGEDQLAYPFLIDNADP